MNASVHDNLLLSQDLDCQNINTCIVGIDASRGRSGGAKTHLIGLLGGASPLMHGIAKVHVWSYRHLLDELPDKPWLVKHHSIELEKNLPQQLLWQYFKLPQELKKQNCSILLNTDAGSVCRYSPNIVMCRDMLAFERNESRRFGWSYNRLRVNILKYVHTASMKKSTGVLFLTNYAAKTIQQYTGQLAKYQVIPHGITKEFRQQPLYREFWDFGREIKCIYVSNADMYKHQWHVVRAISILRKAGYPVKLQLIGGGNGPAMKLLNKTLNKEDPDGLFVEVVGAVPHKQIPGYLAEADLFVFASSCENMPNTLIEAMAMGLPIACSDRGPMPDLLQDGGSYFNPESATSIASAIETLLTNSSHRSTSSTKARYLSQQYSWERCASETWRFLVDTSMRTA